MASHLEAAIFLGLAVAALCDAGLRFCIICAIRHHKPWGLPLWDEPTNPQNPSVPKIQDAHRQRTARVAGGILLGILGLWWLGGMLLTVSVTGSPVGDGAAWAKMGEMGAVLLLGVLGLWEDVRQHIPPRRRLAWLALITFMFTSAASSSHPWRPLPFIDDPWGWSQWLSNPVLSFGISWLFVLSLVNATNMIDGLNGLLAGWSLWVLSNIALCWVLTSSDSPQLPLDALTVGATGITLVFLAVFLRWNVPMGLIFLGDGGAYLLGGIVSLAVFHTLGLAKDGIIQTHGFSGWGLLSLTLYPILEISATVLRRVVARIRKKQGSIMAPDRGHLHTLAMRAVKRRKPHWPLWKSNSWATGCLVPFGLLGSLGWLGGMMLEPFKIPHSPVLITILSIILQTVAFAALHATLSRQDQHQP